MVGVPTALHLAAELLAVAAAVGLAVALLEGSFGRAEGEGPAGRRPDLIRVVGGAGGVVYAIGHALTGAQVGSELIWSALAVAGLAGLAVGVAPERIGSLGRHRRRAAGGPTGSAAPLLVPLAPQGPALVAAAAGLVAAARVSTAGGPARLVGAGLGLMSVGHALAPGNRVLYSVATLLGALLVFAWLWIVSRRAILAKLLTAFITALLALAMLLAGVLSTVGTTELVAEELGRLERVADQLAGEIASWPAAAIRTAASASIAPEPLLGELSPGAASSLYNLAFADQDFYLVLDAQGVRVNVHPPSIGGSLELTLAGDAAITSLRTQTGEGLEVGGLLSTGGRLVAYGAVPLRSSDLRPEDLPDGVLITGRVVDEVWAEQQSNRLDLGIVGQVAGDVAFQTAGLSVDGDAVAAELGARRSADVSLGDRTLFAAAAEVEDPADGRILGRIMTVSSPSVIANLETTQAQRLFAVSLFAALIAAAVALLVTRRVTRPIAELTAAAVEVGRGDLDRRAAIASDDEVGTLGDTFDEMVASLAGQQRDLAESASREASLRGRLESLTRSMGDALIAVDDTGTIITFNPAAERLTGMSAEEVAGEPLARMLRGRVLGDGAEVADGGRGTDVLGILAPTSQEEVGARLALEGPDGEVTPVAGTAAPVRSLDGEILGRVYVLRDISREVEIERMKTEFLANVSHELRTPITPIKGYANVLARRDVGPERTAAFAEEILSSTRRLERIVGMIVDFAALDSGRVRLAREPLDIGELIASTLERWRSEHPQRRIAHLLDPRLPRVAADADYLRRCLDELLDNAIKFSPDGEEVTVAARPDNGRVRVDVIDRGIGLEPDAAAALFSDFVQADGTETRHFGGLGLGLALVTRILDGIGAEATVASAPGQGSTFSLLLPATATPASSHRATAPPSAMPTSPAYTASWAAPVAAPVQSPPPPSRPPAPHSPAAPAPAHVAPTPVPVAVPASPAVSIPDAPAVPVPPEPGKVPPPP